MHTTRPLVIKHELQDVWAIIQSFEDQWIIEDHDNLHCISSGAPAPKEIEVDLLQSKTQGDKEFQECSTSQ